MLFLFKNGNENDAPAQRAGLFASLLWVAEYFNIHIWLL